MSISVFGAGAFGTALAISLAKSGPVTLYARSETSARAMQTERKNVRKLPGVELEQSITVTSDPAVAAQSETILMAVPMQMLRGAVQSHRDLLVNQTLVACCKGIETDSGLGPVAVLSTELPNRPVALLTGPSFARDIARGLPTALTLASESPEVGTRLQQALSQSNLRLYRTTDTVGAELGGALKNVIAIACGAVIGAGLGDSARAALMTRGYAEMQRLALVL
ncbi:MAG: NAD(P)H-dependent glycerol-3-phosphate dehydrogenase, partial [Pseudomonadota bacterium]